MRKSLLFALVLALAGTPSFAGEPQALRLGDVTLALGATVAEVEAELPPDLLLVWARDRLPQPVTARPTEDGTTYESRVVVGGEPVLLTYRDEHGEHASIGPRSQPDHALASLVFEQGRLVRAKRLIGEPNLSRMPAAAVMASVVETLAGWGDGEVTVAVSDLEGHGTRLRELRFTSGDRQLVLVESERMMQLVENLGRGDIPVVSSRP